jgi:S1-C subfamily serine protease
VIFDGMKNASSRRARRPASARLRGAFARVALGALVVSVVLLGAWAHVAASRASASRATAARAVGPRAAAASNASHDVVVLRLERSDGSACHAVCADAGVAWTAAHCVDGAGPLRVIDAEGRVVDVERVERPRRDASSAGDVTHRAREDRAELRLRDSASCVAPPRQASIRRGEPVELRLFRSPSRTGRAGRSGSGVLATTPLVCAGDSGAPLVDRAGALIGLAVGRSGVGCDEGASFFVTTPPSSEERLGRFPQAALPDGAQRPKGAKARGRGPLGASCPVGEGLATDPRRS